MKRILFFSILFLGLYAGLALSLDLITRPVSPAMSWRVEDLARFDPQWLHVKFVEGSNVVFDHGRLADDTGLDLSSVGRALAGERVLEIRSTIPHDRAMLRQWKAQGEAASGAKGPDLSLWFDVRVAGGRAAVARLTNALNASPAVEIAHPAPIVEPAVLQGPVLGSTVDFKDRAITPDFTGQQGYLYNPPVGLNAGAAWAVSGGRGESMKFIDVELCWTEDHEDFNYANLFYVGGAAQDPSYESHGTAVLGEVIGQNNGYGINGFAPAVQYGVVAVTVNEWPVVPHRFQEAVDHLDRGDVWLIELQMYPPGRDATPMEWLQVNYDVIWTGVFGRGVLCVEAGANGTQNLDDASWGGVFDRNVRDSGAIMVAAGTPNGLVAEWFTNWGSRMDVHAWGSSIVTTGYGDLYNGGTLQKRYTAQFGGTSGASPMVTGSALCLQGIARANLSNVLDPVRIRAILHDTGTPHQGTKYIGPRPNLAAAVQQVLLIQGAEEGLAAGNPSWVQCYPNPFRSAATVRLTLPEPGQGTLSVYDAEGRLIRILLDGVVPPGATTLLWNGRDARGRSVDTGVYFLRLDTRGVSQSARTQRIR